MYRSTEYTRPSSVSVVDVSVERGLRHRAQPASAVRALQPQEKRPDLALSRGASSSRTRPSLDLAFVARGAICAACVVARGLNCDQLFRFAESTCRFSTIWIRRDAVTQAGADASCRQWLSRAGACRSPR